MTRRKRLLSSLAACGILGACSGPSFTKSEASGGTSSGGATNTGGSGATSTGGSAGDGGQGAEGAQGARGGTDAGEGGQGAQGAEGGTTPNGGTAGNAGSGAVGGSGSGGSAATGGLAGRAGSGGTGVSGFPSYGVLDDFNRDAVALGDGWTGDVNSYEIESETLVCSAGLCPGVFWHEAFGVEQEVFATIVSFSGVSPEINLALKAQGNTTCDLIEVLYAPMTGLVSLDACWEGQWRSFGSVPADLSPGDQLGARARSNGIIDVFKNGMLLDSFDASEFPYYDLDGYIGVDGIVATNAVPNVWDDFGGGGG